MLAKLTRTVPSQNCGKRWLFAREISLSDAATWNHSQCFGSGAASRSLPRIYKCLKDTVKTILVRVVGLCKSLGVRVFNSVSHVFEFVVQDSRSGLDPRAVVVMVTQRGIFEFPGIHRFPFKSSPTRLLQILRLSLKPSTFSERHNISLWIPSPTFKHIIQEDSLKRLLSF